ncbi:MAG: site-2 protease family protein, partial [Planctomycetaceae bacterium]
MFSQRFRLGTFFGIGLFVHWTFGLLVAYAMYLAWSAGAGGWMIAYSVAQLLTVFICVALHEYGHALAARRFGVGTQDITLLPIGGVARLNRIPRVPYQEFVIAIAGPAVNVVIATLLATLIYVADQGELFRSIASLFFENQTEEQAELIKDRLMTILTGPSLVGFGLSILMINLMLVLFNMIPAFPMDGGRVLRSLLAMVFPYVSATRWAQRIGMVCALLMA